MPSRESGQSRVPGPGPQQAPREMARTNQHIDGQTHHQAHMQQPWQPAGPQRSLLLRFPHPKAKPDYRTLWSQWWQSAQPVSVQGQPACVLPCPSPELAGLATAPPASEAPEAHRKYLRVQVLSAQAELRARHHPREMQRDK